MRQERQDFTSFFSKDIYNEGLIEMENKLLRLNDKSLSDVGLLPSVCSYNNSDIISRYNADELTAFVNDNVLKLVPDQTCKKHAFNKIIDSIDNCRGFFFRCSWRYRHNISS